MPEDPDNGGSRGFGFVTLDKDAAQAAIDATDGMEVDGRVIRVNAAQPKGKGGSFNRRDESNNWDNDGDGY
jgi:RNA recognition motif-containing protein